MATFAIFADLGGQCCAYRNGRPAGNDSICAQDAFVDIGNVHAAALAFAKAFRGTPEFFHHPRYVRAFGDTMPVSPMGADDGVFIGEMLTNADGIGFLSSVKVGEASDLAVHDFGVSALFKFADGFHHAICAQQVLFVQAHADLLIGSCKLACYLYALEPGAYSVFIAQRMPRRNNS